MFKFNKRGIAPLIATLLLISFAVSLGVVIMNFGRAQVELQAECPINIGLKFAVIGGENQLCYSAGKKDLSFTIENGANIDVTGLIVSIIGTQKAETFELNNINLKKAGTYIGHVNYDSAVAGDMRQIKISPKIVLYDEEQICTEKALIAEKVVSC